MQSPVRLILQSDNSFVITKRWRQSEKSLENILRGSSEESRDGSNSEWLEILLGVSSIHLLRFVPAHRSVRWQSHDNQRRIVIGNPISLPNCTPNRFAGTNGNFLHVPRVRAHLYTYTYLSLHSCTHTYMYVYIYVHTWNRVCVVTFNSSCAICVSLDAYSQSRLFTFNI